MEAFVIIALVGFGLLAAELLLPTGGILAALGAIGLAVAGIVALGSDSDAADFAGAALITLAVLSAGTFVFVSRKVLRTSHGLPPRGGTEEMIGGTAEARSAIAESGQAFARGGLWSARLVAGAGRVGPGDKVVIEAVDGLTLVVAPLAAGSKKANDGEAI